MMTLKMAETYNLRLSSWNSLGHCMDCLVYLEKLMENCDILLEDMNSLFQNYSGVTCIHRNTNCNKSDIMSFSIEWMIIMAKGDYTNGK